MASSAMASSAVDKKEHVLPGEHVYDGMTMSSLYPAEVLDRVKTFPFSDDDILIATYPKSGTTWMQEIVYLICNPDHFQIAKSVIQDERFPFLEVHKPPKRPDLEVLLERKPPRFIKTHLPYSILKEGLKGKKTKIIVVMRNVKDVLVSYYHFYKATDGFGNFSGTWDEFFGLFMKNKICNGSWFDYNLSYWQIKDQENVFIVKYEDMKEDIHTIIQEIAKFLGKDIRSEIVYKIAQETSFDSMKVNPMVNKVWNKNINQHVSPFIRKGVVGDWKNQLTVAQSEYIDDLQRMQLAETGFEY